MKKGITVFLSFAIVFLFSVQVNACTLFAATGDEWVQGGGSLIAKNRDEKPSKQYVKVVSPDNGYRYFGLFVDSNNGELRGGINEKGLVVICSSASTLAADVKTEDQKNRFRSDYGVTDEYIISKCATVKDALALDKSIWAGAQNIMLADKDEIACVEIGPDGSIAVKETMNGTLNHTNHYVYEDMVWANVKPYPESVTRYERSGQLLAETSHPFIMEDFIAFCNDKNAGVHDSIYRDGENNSSQTLATMVYDLPKNGTASVYMKVRENPEDKGKEKVYRYSLDEIFKK